MLALRGDFFTKEFLVHSSIKDDAPQRMRLKVRNPLSSEDLLKQIERQLVDPMSSMPSLAVSRIHVAPGSHLFAFSAEENCFVPLDGKPADALRDFGRLLLHSSSAAPSSVPSSVISRQSSIPDGSQRVSNECESHGDTRLSRTPHDSNVGFSKSPDDRPVMVWPPSSAKKRASATSRTVRLPPLHSAVVESSLNDGLNRSTEMLESKKVSSTMELMLQVMGFLLTEYTAHSSKDVIEPTEEGLWSLIEEILYRRGNPMPHSLDPPTVDAFLQTILRSITTGREYRATARQVRSEASGKNCNGNEVNPLGYF
ncbi:hypothetical protein DQ04_00291070 [Trypanosoma grayi]|uniref:hypothetical protein n=1 Tax=Trypanosoma grayi TaxID=71804 RepID=UPI0004F3FC1F|nr:hypothetical protein DQ04_00291070 [Trypanosoma grayi]KEG14821.1 hypothetical protein DQ04_00291070 [Trypanosoma grayi]